MGRAIDYHAEVHDVMPAEPREERRVGLVSGLWWMVRDVYSEIKAELRLIVG